MGLGLVDLAAVPVLVILSLVFPSASGVLRAFARREHDERHVGGWVNWDEAGMLAVREEGRRDGRQQFLCRRRKGGEWFRFFRLNQL